MGYIEFKEGLDKKAGIYIDNWVKRPIGHVIGGGLVGVPLTTAIDVYGGELAADTNEDSDEAHGDPKGIAGWIPGIAGYNVTQQKKKNLRAAGSKDPGSLSASESFGSLVSTPLAMLVYGLLGAAGGAIGGGLVGGTEGALAGAGGGLAGGALGGFLSPYVGAALAGVTRTRTPEEHAAYASDPRNVKYNWLVPGISSYNYFKTMGRIHADQVAAEEAARTQQEENKA